MYQFDLNIGSLGTPVSGSGWLTVNPFFNGTTLERSKDGIRVRDLLSGSLRFFGAEYTALKSMTDLTIPIRVYVDSTLRLEGELSLVGKYDTFASVVELEFEQMDEYTDILKNMDAEVYLADFTKYDISQAYSSASDLVARAWETGYSGAIPLPDVYTLCSTGTPDPWNAGINYIAATEMTAEGYPKLWHGSTALSFVLFSGVAYIAITDNINSQPDTHSTPGSSPPPDWLVVQGTTISKYGQERADFQFHDDAVWDDVLTKWKYANCSTGSYTKTTEAVKLFDIIYELIRESDPTNNVIETNYNTYFDSYYPHLKNLFVKSFKNETKIKLSEVIKMMESKFNLDWELDSLLFKFKHPRELLLSTGENITNRYGTDWSILNYDYDLSEKVGKELWQFGESNREDFKVQGVTYDNGIEELKEYTDNYNTDFVIANALEDGLLLICAELSGLDWVLRSATGAVSGVSQYNADLSVANCIVDHLKYDRAFALGDIDGTLTVLTPKRNNIVSIKAPYKHQAEIDFTRTVVTTLADCEITSLKVKLNGSLAELELRF